MRFEARKAVESLAEQLGRALHPDEVTLVERAYRRVSPLGFSVHPEGLRWLPVPGGDCDRDPIPGPVVPRSCDCNGNLPAYDGTWSHHDPGCRSAGYGDWDTVVEVCQPYGQAFDSWTGRWAPVWCSVRCAT